MPPKLVFRQIVQIYILGFLIYFLSYYNVLKKKKKKKLYCSQSLIVKCISFWHCNQTGRVWFKN